MKMPIPVTFFPVAIRPLIPVTQFSRDIVRGDMSTTRKNLDEGFLEPEGGFNEAGEMSAWVWEAEIRACEIDDRATSLYDQWCRSKELVPDILHTLIPARRVHDYLKREWHDANFSREFVRNFHHRIMTYVDLAHVDIHFTTVHAWLTDSELEKVTGTVDRDHLNDLPY